MRNIKLTIEYDGTNYAGWQVQAGGQRTIQKVLEEAIRKILRERVKVTGSGRTDAGVHAEAQVANFKASSGIGLDRLRIGLNAVLPDDISVIKAEEADSGFHSRFSAKSKVYRYTILNRPSRSAIMRNRAYFCIKPLDLKLMQEESRALLGRHNFKSFKAACKRRMDTVRTMKKIKVSRDKDFIYIDMQADGFLRNMARSIAGTLIDIGRGKLPPGSAKKILLAKNRRIAGPTASARGLCLVKVNY